MSIRSIFNASVIFYRTKTARVYKPGKNLLNFNFTISFALTFIVAPDLVSSRCMCGIKNPTKQTRIVGGEITIPHEFPWQVSITGFGNQPFCGGSLLNDRYILTAGHCIYQFVAPSSCYSLNLKKNIVFRRPAFKIQVILGEHNYKNASRVRKKFEVAKLILHPQYDPMLLINDIALIKIKSSVNFTNIAKPACLLRPTADLVGITGVTSGWGRTEEDGAVSQILRKVIVPLVSLDECRRAFGHNFIVSSMLCGLYKPGGKDACQGDSGGPLMYFRNNRYYLIGVVSWGLGCARPNYPAIYTRVDSFYAWINENTADAKFCAD